MTINELIIHLAQIEDKTQKVFFHVGECSTPYVEVLRVEPGEQRVLNLYSVDPPEKVDVLILAGK